MRKALLATGAGAVVLLASGGVLTTVALYESPNDSPTLSLPTPAPSPEPTRTPLLLPATGAAPLPTQEGLVRALSLPLRDRALVGGVALSVVDVTSGTSLLASGAAQLVTPASTAKIATAVATLTVLDPASRFTTRVVEGGPGDLVLVGGGDPTLAGAHPLPGFPTAPRLATLAEALKGKTFRRVVVDDSLFTGPRTGPGWRPGYVTHGNVAPVSALAVDEGRTSTKEGSARTTDPALEAGRQLAGLLHVKVVVRGKAPASAVELAHVDSAPISALVERMLTHSDNDLAEVLGRHVALAQRQPASFDGEARALAAVLGQPGLRDASGLSVQNRMRPSTLTALLRRAAMEARLAPVLSGLPIAGFDGTLADRFRSGPPAVAAGEVRAKTGTLSGVSALAGVVRTRDGRLLAFAVVANDVRSTTGAQKALDQVVATLAACGCR